MLLIDGKVLTFLIFPTITSIACAKTGYGPGDQDWGFIDIRKGAHMFYWLYYTTANVTNYTQRPLAIWLQGGPGLSSTGVGNFLQLGPLDLDGKYRNWTWVKDMNVLFIDSPVGAGFSYVDDEKYLTTNISEIALDLVELMKGFYKKHPEFENVSLHIFSQSYGGKMAPAFALELYYAIQRNEIKCNLSSVAIGAPWTSPTDSITAMAPLMWNMGLIDQYGFETLTAVINKTSELVQTEEWSEALKQYIYLQNLVAVEFKFLDLNNFAKPTNGLDYRDQKELDFRLEKLMWNSVRKALNISSKVRWGSQYPALCWNLIGDFMKPAVHVVRELLDKTDVKVAVLSAQFDLLCPTAGAVNWVNKMSWSYSDKYDKSPRLGFYVNGVLEGYEKSAGNFSMFWVNRAGHWIPSDNPVAMSYILGKLINL